MLLEVGVPDNDGGDGPGGSQAAGSDHLTLLLLTLRAVDLSLSEEHVCVVAVARKEEAW